MTLLNLITKVKERFPSVEPKELCQIIAELERRVIDEIFSPCGISVDATASNDINSPLMLGEENLSLYIYFVYAVLAIKELDFEASNAYSSVFNEKFKELAVHYRRSNLPVKNTFLRGGI